MATLGFLEAADAMYASILPGLLNPFEDIRNQKVSVCYGTHDFPNILTTKIVGTFVFVRVFVVVTFEFHSPFILSDSETLSSNSKAESYTD